MGDAWDEETVLTVRKYALQNALEYDGAGQIGSTLGRLLAERQDLRSRAKELSFVVKDEVAKANSMIHSEGAESVRSLIENIDPEAVQRTKQTKREGLKPLDNISTGVVLRFAPNPNGPLSIGHARGVVINHEYASMHDGKMVLRFDDTDTIVKPPMKDAYEWIIEDYEWLTGSKPDIVVRASERMPVYIRYAEEMIRKSAGYVCECSAEEFRALRVSKKACPHRGRSVEENIEAWGKMLDGRFSPGDAVVRVLTDMSLPNPALRDWPAWRIQHEAHPMVGNSYLAWPLLDFQSAIEDHEQGVTHIIRGKDLMDSTRKQKLLYDHLGWKYPETLYWGRVSIHGSGSFSTSEIRRGIESKMYSGWDDPRVPTLRSMRRRGFDPVALRSFWVDMGVTQKDVAVAMESIEASNAASIDSTSRRISLVSDPMSIAIQGELPREIVLPFHPDDEKAGTREISLASGTAIIEKEDLKNSFRLKGLANVESVGGIFEIGSVERDDDRPIIHWLSPDSSVTCELVMAIGDELNIMSCLVEDADLESGEVVQLERKGFARVEKWSPNSRKLLWLHI
jgi:glutamyl-tRNA synthetase